MPNFIPISRFLGAFIALLLFASSVSARDFPLQPRATILPSSSSISINGFKASLGNFSGAKVDPSSITLSIAGKDVTNITDITVSRGASYGEVYDGFNFEVKLTDPLKAQPNLEVKLAGTTKDGTPFESKTIAGVVAKIGIAPIHIIKIPSYDSVLEDATIKTPVSVFEHGAVNILYQEGDKLENFVVNIPVFALDEKGMPVSVDVSNLSLSGLSSGVSSGSTTMTAGLAVVPLTITSSNPESLKLEVSTARFDGGARSGTRVSTRNPLVVVIPVIVIAAEDVAGLFIGLGLVIGDLLHPTPPQQPFADWVSDQRGQGLFLPLISPVPTTIPPFVGGSCKPQDVSQGIIFLPAEIVQAPFRDTKPLTPADLSKAQLPPCNGTWTPPTETKLDDLKRKLINARELTSSDVADPGLLKILNSNIFKYLYPAPLNKIVGLVKQVVSAVTLGLPFLRSISDAQNVSPGPARFTDPANAGATKHAADLRKTLSGIKKRLLNRGESGPNRTGVPCYSDDELDVLHALYELINETLKIFDT